MRSASLGLAKPGEGAIGLRNSDGKVPEAGVCREEEELLERVSKPAAAMVAVEAEAIGLGRRSGKRMTGRSNECVGSRRRPGPAERGNLSRAGEGGWAKAREAKPTKHDEER